MPLFSSAILFPLLQNRDCPVSKGICRMENLFLVLFSTAFPLILPRFLLIESNWLSKSMSDHLKEYSPLSSSHYRTTNEIKHIFYKALLHCQLFLTLLLFLPSLVFRTLYPCLPNIMIRRVFCSWFVNQERNETLIFICYKFLNSFNQKGLKFFLLARKPM